jgi:predicted PurR-regulated permease PerM
MKSTPFYTKLAHISISILIGYIAVIGKSILAPLIIALLFALLLMPFASFLERKLRFPRAMAAFMVLLVLISGVAGLMVLLGSQLSDFARELPAFEKQLMLSLDDLQHWISRSFNINNRQQAAYINQTAETALGHGTEHRHYAGIVVIVVTVYGIYIFIYVFPAAAGVTAPFYSGAVS